MFVSTLRPADDVKASQAVSRRTNKSLQLQQMPTNVSKKLQTTKKMILSKRDYGRLN